MCLECVGYRLPRPVFTPRPLSFWVLVPPLSKAKKKKNYYKKNWFLLLQQRPEELSWHPNSPSSVSLELQGPSVLLAHLLTHIYLGRRSVGGTEYASMEI